MKIILKKNAKVTTLSPVIQARIPYTLSKEINTDKEVIFDYNEVSIESRKDGEYLVRSYHYNKPFPIFNGYEIESIEWMMNDDNESIED